MGSSSGLAQSIRDSMCGVRRMAIGANLRAAAASSMNCSLVLIFCSSGLRDSPKIGDNASERKLCSFLVSGTVFRS
jgi:hypothetical protein